MFDKFLNPPLQWMQLPLREMYLYSEFFWSVFSRIRTRKTPNTDTFHAVYVNMAVSYDNPKTKNAFSKNAL